MRQTSGEVDRLGWIGAAAAVLVAALTLLAAFRVHDAPFLGGMISAVFIGVVLNAIYWSVYRMLLLSRDAPAWQVRFLPLRGRWLCYLFCIIVAIPGMYLSIGLVAGFALLVMSLFGTQ